MESTLDRNGHFAKRRSAILLAALGACLVGGSTPAPAQRLSVTNPLDVTRLDEIVDLPLSEVVHHLHAKTADQIVVLDDTSKQRLPSQTYSTTGAAPDRFL